MFVGVTSVLLASVTVADGDYWWMNSGAFGGGGGGGGGGNSLHNNNNANKQVNNATIALMSDKR